MAKETGMVAIYATWNARTFDVAVLRWRWKKIGALQLLQLSCLSFCMLFVFAWCDLWFKTKMLEFNIRSQWFKIILFWDWKSESHAWFKIRLFVFLIFLKYQEKYTPLKAQINYRLFFLNDIEKKTNFSAHGKSFFSPQRVSQEFTSHHHFFDGFFFTDFMAFMAFMAFIAFIGFLIAFSGSGVSGKGHCHFSLTRPFFLKKKGKQIIFKA